MRNSFCFLLPILILILALSHKLAQAASSIPQLSFANNAIGTTGGDKFIEVMTGRLYDPEAVLSLCAHFVPNTLYVAAHRPVIQKIKWTVTSHDLVVNPPIATLETDKNDGASVIDLDAGYVASFEATNTQVAHDIVSVLYYMMTALYLSESQLQEPQPTGLLSGIGAYMQIVRNLEPSYWEPRGSGTFFDDGDGITGYFLEYCAGRTDQFVSKLINLMQKRPYDNNYFDELVFEDVFRLWDDYRLQYGTNKR
ncbi:hypothetical protein O6H91_09G076100 [Diphasiastrum complanatum]|uniref:Uncharacterized protein n=1 Tax=Diphasiastrum complanatum TaxID=34168 RepID=A0ACC2CQY9_DIPCM|nr:hypothetical protein O6H91_09G076100 [Diphasiastrum complanatum]